MANATTDTEKTTRSYRNRSQTDVTLDNMIRRTLRVSDPYDYKEVADALEKLYPAESKKMKFEAGGYPFFERQAVDVPPDMQTSSSAEMGQARRDIDRDLNALIGNALLKDIQPELNGWASAIRSAVAEGVAAARFALDPRQRDKTFSVRRLLGDYARVARFVGAMTPTMNLPYRRLAQSLDEAANVLMVIMGEAMANIGFSGGRFLLQAPLSELQARRDAVMNALRNLIGTTQEAFGSNQWPRGLRAYRQFLDHLSRNAQNDIRSLFQENEIARIMDELIDRAAGTTSEGLRALGATAQISLERFRRLVMLGQGIVVPKSPPFTAFLEAVRLFLEAFNNAPSGHRLLAIARPAIVFYGLYGISGPDPPTRRLQGIVSHRGVLAEALDCYLGCNCCSDQVRCQILLDKALYDVDRAIDLYSLGMKNFDEPEQRAAAYGFILNEFKWPDGVGSGCLDVSCTNDKEIVGLQVLERIDTAICGVIKQLWPQGHDNATFTPAQREIMRDELCMQVESEKQWASLLQTMAPNCINVYGLETENDESFLKPTFSLINRAMWAMNVLGPGDRPCTVKDEFPEEPSVTLSKIEENTEPLKTNVGLILVEPNPVDFGEIVYDDENSNVSSMKNVVITNLGRSTLSNIELKISENGPFHICEAAYNGTVVKLSSQQQKRFEFEPGISLAPQERLFVTLSFSPEITADGSGNIPTSRADGLLSVSACDYTGNRYFYHPEDEQCRSISSSAGAARLKGVLLGNDQPGILEMDLFTPENEILTDGYSVEIFHKDRIVVGPIPVRNGRVNHLISREGFADPSLSDLQILIKNPNGAVILREKMDFKFGKNNTAKFVIPKALEKNRWSSVQEHIDQAETQDKEEAAGKTENQ